MRLRVLIIATCIALPACAPPKHTVTFKVTSPNDPIPSDATLNAIRVTETNFKGGTDELLTSIPYADIVDVHGRGPIALSAIISSAGMTSRGLKCEIKVDGESVAESNGENAVSCAGLIR